jgi:hypothetical protein
VYAQVFRGAVMAQPWVLAQCVLTRGTKCLQQVAVAHWMVPAVTLGMTGWLHHRCVYRYAVLSCRSCELGTSPCHKTSMPAVGKLLELLARHGYGTGLPACTVSELAPWPPCCACWRWSCMSRTDACVLFLAIGCQCYGHSRSMCHGLCCTGAVLWISRRLSRNRAHR